MPKKNLHRDYSRLIAFLRKISLRTQLLATLQFLLLLSSSIILVLLGGFFVLELKETIPYLTVFYSIGTIAFLSILSFLWIRKILFKPSIIRLAKGLEEKFPHLRDDVTNSLLLFNHINSNDVPNQVSKELIKAHLRKTTEEISSIQPKFVVNLKKALVHLRLLLPLITAFSIVLAFDPHLLNRSLALILHPFSNMSIQKTIITLEPKGSVMLRGSPLLIKAHTIGHIPQQLELTVWPDGKEALKHTMEPKGNGMFVYPIASAQFSFRYQAHDHRVTSPIYHLRVIDPPDIGKMKLTFLPPDYTGLPKEVKEEGHVEALKGTVVNLEIQATKNVKEGKIVLNQNNQLLLKADGDHLTGSMVVFYPGRYSIQLKDELGYENLNPVQYPIHLILDRYPEVEILHPTLDLEISGHEVIPIVYTVKDDFGLTGVRLSYQMGGRERFINLKGINPGRQIGPETFKWDLTSLDLTPGDRVIFRLEVFDNDSISGPKNGYSKTLTLSVRDERAQAAKTSEEVQQIAETLLDLLADQLEDQKDRQSLIKKMEEILKRIDQGLKRMEKKVDRLDLETLRRNLASLKERMPEESKEPVTQEMERLALFAEDIAKKAKMNEMEAIAKELKNRQRRLIDFLKERKGPLNQEDLAAILKELKDLEELIRSIMDNLSKLAGKLPDEFVNNPDLQGMDFQDYFKDLQEIHKKLMAGDIAGALEAAQRLLQALSEMMAALARAGAQAGMNSLDRIQGEMNRQAGELDKILAEQKEILNETEKIDQDTRQRIEEETEKRLNQSLSHLKGALERFHRSLAEEQKDLVEELERLLKSGNLERFSKLAKELEKAFSGKADQEKQVRELVEKIRGLTPDPKEVMNQSNKEKLPDLSLKEGHLKERTKNIKEKLEMLSQLFPGMDTEILRDLKEAAESMGDASGKLKKEDTPGAIPPEQEAIKRLTRSQQAMQQMAQQMAMQMQANRWGYQWWGYDPRPGWYYGPWVPMPTLPQPEVNRPRERGYTGIEREEFEPPSKDAYKVPKIFREKIMESLKEGNPSQYKREVEKYFRGLTE